LLRNSWDGPWRTPVARRSGCPAQPTTCCGGCPREPGRPRRSRTPSGGRYGESDCPVGVGVHHLRSASIVCKSQLSMATQLSVREAGGAINTHHAVRALVASERVRHHGHGPVEVINEGVPRAVHPAGVQITVEGVVRGAHVLRGGAPCEAAAMQPRSIGRLYRQMDSCGVRRTLLFRH
jgi:hypothetical protein